MPTIPRHRAAGPGCAPKGGGQSTWDATSGRQGVEIGGPIGGTASGTDEGHQQSSSWRGDGGGSPPLSAQPGSLDGTWNQFTMNRAVSLDYSRRSIICYCSQPSPASKHKL